jgi:hypothetical protein
MSHCRKLLFLLLAIVGASVPAFAQSVPARAWHWAGRHKELLLADGLLTASLSADAAESIRCQHEFPVTCVEQNPLMNRHPSEGAYWRWTLGVDGAIIAANHIGWHFMPGRYKHLIWSWSGAMTINEGIGVKQDVDWLERMEGPTQTFTCSVTQGSSGPVLCSVRHANRFTLR